MMTKEKLEQKVKEGLTYNDLGRIREEMEGEMYIQLIRKGEDIEEQLTAIEVVIERATKKAEAIHNTVIDLNLRTYQFSWPSFWAGMLLGSAMTTVSWLMWRIYG